MSARPGRLRRRCRAQDGSFLVEAMVSAFIIVIVGLGVLEAIDRGSRLGGQQKTQAVAGNVAQTEQELIRALSLSEQSYLRDYTTTRTVGGVTYTAVSRSDWVDDSSGEADCTSSGSAADYLRLSTRVTSPVMGTRKPIVLKTLITPGVRAFSDDQGSLAVQVTDRDGDPISGVQLNLTGGATRSDATNASGCVLWGYLATGSAYRVAFSLPSGHVLPDGGQVGDEPVAVVGSQTSNVAFQVDRGGYLRSRFVTKRSRTGDPEATYPKVAHVTNTGGGGVRVGPFAVDGDTMTSGLLFPFTSAYTIHADSCAATEVFSPVAAPRPPPPPAAASATVSPDGTTTTSPQVWLPPLMVVVSSAGVLAQNAIVRVTTPCGTVYRRTTNAAGEIDDPGFPPATSLAVCVSDGTRQRTATSGNVNFNGTRLPLDIASTDPTGTCA